MQNCALPGAVTAEVGGLAVQAGFRVVGFRGLGFRGLGVI